MLSPDFPTIWLSYADHSYIAARLMWFVNLQTTEAPASAHRTIELYLKAFLVSHGQAVRRGSPTWGHQLGELGEAGRRLCEDFAAEAVQRRLSYFQRYFDFVRYPSEGVPNDGSLIWYADDAVLFPLDELVAFIRPRVKLTQEEWAKSFLSSIQNGYQRDALCDHNEHLDQIRCSSTTRTAVAFNTGFRYDRPGC